MQLVSRLRETTLGDLLAALYREGASGVLEIIATGSRHAIHFRRGFVQAVETESATARLGDVAVRGQFAARAAVERARIRAHSKGIRLGQAMVAERLITPSQLDELLSAQRTERLEALYALQDAELRFRVSRPLPAGAVEQLPLVPSEAFHGRPRRRARGGAARKSRLDGSADGAPPRSGPTTAGDPRARWSRPCGSTVAIRATHLSVLGLPAEASLADARVAFRRLALDLHPDRHPHADSHVHETRARQFAAVVAAYRALTSDEPTMR